MADHFQLAACEGKSAFPAWSQANVAARRMRHPARRDRGGAMVYRCEHCRLFHVGHNRRMHRKDDPRPSMIELQESA
jgi:hypothetical protein